MNSSRHAATHGTALALIVLGTNLVGCASGDGERGQNTGATTGTTTTSGTGTMMLPTATTPATTTTAPTTTGTPTTTPTDMAPTTLSPLGSGVMSGASTSSDRYAKGPNVTRDGVPYFFMANGWGPGFESQSVEWNGTSFTVASMNGMQGMNYEPASYPTVFCGRYSSNSSLEGCGLPADIASLTQLRTGWSWDAGGNTGEYNAAYDVWLSDGTKFTSFFMVWLRDPSGQQPAGSPGELNVMVPNVPGTWDIWTGEVNGAPIVNYVAQEDEDIPSLEFDLLDFFKDAAARGIEVQGTQVMGVAVGFEIWNGPITNLKTLDFYVDAR